jgi:pimeloyl-ACP methyl ester carboxylesterase
MRVHQQLVLALCLTPGLLVAQPRRPRVTPQTYVIVHGAWGGGWDWRRVDSALTKRGHHVYRVTLTGLGERTHLANANIGLTTHIADVVNTVMFEQLSNVILVGHSYGGMVITGAADRMPERIKRVVYVDAFLPDSGESMAMLAGQGFNAMVESSTKDGLIVPAWVRADEPAPKDVPHPLKTMTDTLALANAAARQLAAHYILTMDKGATTDGFSPSAQRAAERGWPVDTLITDHTPERSAVPALVRLLLQSRK